MSSHLLRARWRKCFLDLCALRSAGGVGSPQRACHLQQRSLSSQQRRLGQTEVLFQSGLTIRELPLVVKKVNDVLAIAGMDACHAMADLAASSDGDSSQSAMDPEAEQLIRKFDRCFSVTGIFRLLETIPMGEVSPPVAIHALKKMIDLENNVALRNSCYKETLADSRAGAGDQSEANGGGGGGDNSNSFMRKAFINQLLDIVYHSRDPTVILEGLRVLSRDCFPDEVAASYKRRMCEETLVCVSERVFDLPQICEAVRVLADFYTSPSKPLYFHETDKLWSALFDRADQINADTISGVFAILPHLKASRDIVLKLLVGYVGNFWQDYKTSHVLEILRAFTEMESHSVPVMQVISQWLSVNVHNLSENEMLAVIYCFHKLSYIDDSMIRTMERYIRVRGCTIREKDLVATICDYCVDFRVRSSTILEGAGEYFILHGGEGGGGLSTPQVYSLTRAFGLLDFHPPNGFKFWQIVEHCLESKWAEFPPKEVLSLLMTFVYLERYPLNFVRKVFDPHFLDRLHRQQQPDDLATSLLTLRLFHNSMKREARNYTRAADYMQIAGKLPLEKTWVLLDTRSQRMAQTLLSTMVDVVGGDANRVKLSVLRGPRDEDQIYLAEMVIYSQAAATLLRLGFEDTSNGNIAVLIHPADHYCYDKRHLVGRQVMRARHFKRMGFRIMHLDYSKLQKLPNSRKKKYLSKKYEELAEQKEESEIK